MIEAFDLERLDPPLDMRVHQRCSNREVLRLDAGFQQRVIELGAELSVVVTDKNHWLWYASISYHLCEALGCSRGPISCWMKHRFRGDDLPGLHMHEGKNGVSFQPGECDYALGEVIARPERCGVALKERAPYLLGSIWRGLNAVLFQDGPNGGARDGQDSKLAELTDDFCIAPSKH